MSKYNKLTRVLFYEPYPMGFGGNFNTQKLILERLDRKIIEPIVMSPMDGKALDEFRRMGVTCEVLSPGGDIAKYGGTALKAGLFRRIKSVFNLLAYNILLYRYIKDKEIDVIYSNSVRAEIIIAIAAFMSRIPTVLYVKGELANPLIDRLCLMSATKILFFCEQNRDDRYPIFVKFFKKKISVLRIGLDLNPIEKVKRRDHSELKKELEITPDNINVAILAQLYRPKGQYLAIEAMSKLIHEYPNIRLYIVGDPVIQEYNHYKDELLELTYAKKLDNNIKFTGWRKDALDIAYSMDIILHPSLAEGFGRAVLESMALGKPVIASAVGGLREAIENGKNGFLIQPGDTEDLTFKWRELIENINLRIKFGNNAKQKVLSDYMIDDKVQKLSHIWARVARG